MRGRGCHGEEKIRSRSERRAPPAARGETYLALRVKGGWPRKGDEHRSTSKQQPGEAISTTQHSLRSVTGTHQRECKTD